uniref:TIR domain-containing protein n=1 Tax=Cannabis sativa TaxID=3483 RepID=A0A803QAD4_CANSA
MADYIQSPAISYSQKKYDVFISFRGEDTRANFTSHLHEKLKKEGIETYIDDKLERGEEISNALSEAIKDSKISIVVFSKDYASSSWCLDELVHILQCVERKTQIVGPVFYHVDPSDVRKQIGSYAEAFKKHEDRHNDTTIRRWREALTKAANHSGWDVSKSSNEAVVVSGIFNFVRKELRSKSSSHHYSKQDIFGIDNSIADLHKLLSNYARIGICGMGGLGKTTLAQIVFNQSCHQYDSHYFFRNVREEFQKHGTNLKEEFFRQLSNEKDLQYGHLDSLKERLSHKKFLIVLDDVDDLDQYNCLLEDSHSWLNSESKLIITSRNHQVLRNIIGNDERMIYNLKRLKKKIALELFCLHAFKRKSPEESEKELSLKFVNYAQGLPLALKVLGSHLFSKNKDLWESLLNKIIVDPDQNVTSKLKISFDGLDSKQQSIFLDIACFFRGYPKYLVRDILDDCGDFNIAIEVLIDRVLPQLKEYFMLIVIVMS